jgi:hypothetical protein
MDEVSFALGLDVEVVGAFIDFIPIIATIGAERRTGKVTPLLLLRTVAAPD